MALNRTEFDYDREHKVMKMFTENAKSYIQLSGAAIAVSVAFVRQIVGVSEGLPIVPKGWLLASWIGFLSAIVSGAFYQYLAAKYMEMQLTTHSYKGWDWLASQPGRIYGVMLVAFYLGVLSFVVGASLELITPK